MTDWPIRQLRDVTVSLNHKRVPVSALERAKRKGPYPYYGASGIVDWVDDYLFDQTYLLISEDGENLKTRKTPIAFKAHGKYWVNNHAHILDEVEPGILDFLEHAFRELDISGYITGAVQPKLNKRSLESIELAIPKLEERLDINLVLNSLDDKIELNRQMNEVLEGMARAVFRDWFVDFGPTRRKIAGEGDPVKILGGAIGDHPQAQKTAALFPDRLGENGLPEGWEEKPFSDLVHIIGGGTPKTKTEEYWGGDIPWFSVVDTPSGSDTFVFGTQKQITQAGLKNSAAKLIEAGTTIISARGTVGNLAIAGNSMTFNQSCYALKGKGAIGQAFAFLGAQRLVQDLQRMAHGAVFSTITRSTFSGVEFAFPSENICCDFEDIMKPIFAKIKANVEENQTLAEMRDLLLPKLMSGEIRLREGG